ncbi:transmembrane protein, partial [Clarias magur]
MTPNVLLLILALTACLTEPVRCEDDDGSGVQDKIAEQLILATIHTPAVTDVSDYPITVLTQEDEVSGVAETLAQVTSEKNSTIRRIFNETDTKAHNVTTVEVNHDKGRKLPNDVTSGDKEDHQEEDEKTDNPPEQEEKDDQETYIIVAASLTLALLLVAAVVGLLYLCRRRRGKSTPDPEKDDPYLDDDYEEKVPMPMFEDDMPSVMELEMEDFEKWMIKG